MEKRCYFRQLLPMTADNPRKGEYVVLIAFGRQGFVIWCVLVASLPAQAGVFESIHPVTAKPIRWVNPQEIPYSIDQGSLGQLNTQQATDLVEAMMAIWENEGGGAIHFVNKGALDQDVTTETMKDFISTSVCADNVPPKIASMIAGQSPIIFDTDGSIIDALAGPGTSRKVVGKSAFRCFSGTLADPKGVTQAFLIMNGRFIDGLPDPVDLPMNVFAGVILHELGHFLGLHHSMVNEEIYAGVLNGTRSASDSKYIPVMYPLILPNATASTVLKPDDVAILRELYPAPNETWGAIAGSVLSVDGSSARGVNVVARRTDDPLCQAVSTVTGRECTPMLASNNEPNVLSESCSTIESMGDYAVRGLSPGDYTIEASEIVEQGGARLNMFPKGAGQDLPGEPVILPDPVAVQSAVVTDIRISLTPLASPHQTGIESDLFLKAAHSECKTDPVDYTEFVAFGDARPADSSASQSPPAAAMPAVAGCSLIR